MSAPSSWEEETRSGVSRVRARLGVLVGHGGDHQIARDHDGAVYHHPSDHRPSGHRGPILCLGGPSSGPHVHGRGGSGWRNRNLPHRPGRGDGSYRREIASVGGGRGHGLVGHHGRVERTTYRNRLAGVFFLGGKCGRCENGLTP